MTRVMSILHCPLLQARVEVVVIQKSSPHCEYLAAKSKTSAPAMISLSSTDLPSKGIRKKEGDVCFSKCCLNHLLTYSFTSRSLSELEGIHVGGDMGDKVRQVTERATLFRITSNAMINVGYTCLNYSQRQGSVSDTYFS